MMRELSELVHRTCAKAGCSKMARWYECDRFYYYVCNEHKNTPPALLHKIELGEIKKDDPWKSQPHNQQQGQPCPAGCIMRRNVTTGELVLDGDCRAPWDKKCYLNAKENDNEQI